MAINSKDFYTYDEIKEAASYIQEKSSHHPTIGLILGSGLNPLAQEIENAHYISYEDIPHFPYSTVPGHAGRLVIGHLSGKTILAMQGRSHLYEGFSVQHITLPIRAMQVMGIKTLIVTNAAGGINASFQAGDLMLIRDHINLAGMAGNNPLRGPNLDEFGPRFPSMTHPYDSDLIELAYGIARRADLPLREGVYTYLAGPSFESPADIRYLKVIGADAVGMSTVPEVIVANHGGMQVLGLSSITNVTVQESDSGLETSHEEVLETGQLIVPRLITLLKGVVEEID